ncbi:RICIN domain-containing protein [Streptomyces sp. NPDC003703]|uniref:RICIN domain-containing protein n=1 Tax=Streptomyces sp. NPDC003283 TaxID=3364681 RepID=UPI0036A9020F
MTPRPTFLQRALRRPKRHRRVLPPLLALTVLATLGAGPDIDGPSFSGAAPVADSYDGFDSQAAEQVRQDQCLVADAARIGGPSTYVLAQNALNQPPDQLHATANREYWNSTPLRQTFEKDRDTAAQEASALDKRVASWAIGGLPTPGGFKSVADFEKPPGLTGDSGSDFYVQTGIGKWIGSQLWSYQRESDLYKDPTTETDPATFKAVTDLGSPLYSDQPPLGSDYQLAFAEYQTWHRLADSDKSIGADDARVFLASGGFPRTAAEPGSTEYRVAVEDLKSRFAACAWRAPLDPRKVLGKEVADASTEWQQEIASQATQRNQILDANRTAVQALQAGATGLGEMLGQSWIADHLTRWQDWWSPGGRGWIDDSPLTVHLHADKNKCLEVAGGSDKDGALVQIYTCHDSGGQQWQIIGDQLVNVHALKCLDVRGGNSADGTIIRIWTCNQSPSQRWEYSTHGTTQLLNPATGKCVDLHTPANSQDALLHTCNGTDAQKFDIVPTGHHGTEKLDYPTTGQFDKAKKGIDNARAAALKQLSTLKAQLATAQTAAASSDKAEQAAYAIADTNGAPRGRGLLVGQQKAQVTKGAVAALDAMVKAGETAEAATRASAGDSATIAQRALAQAAQSKAEFRKKAAEAAEAQAKAAADAAKIHRDNAKKDKETAEAKLAVAVKAEGDAKAAAADAHAKRLAAEAEEKTAKAEKETAAAKQAEAAEHKKNAETQAAAAKDAQDKAEAAEKTAQSRRDAAVKARDDARAKRDDAWEAEQKADAARAKADAKAAYADSLDAGDAATAARAAADEADQHATAAETAATKARSEADAATKAAADADAAATRAEAAAKRARSDADAAQAAKLKADAAVRTATSAAADAIQASKDAAEEAKTAVKLADEAEAHAKDAKSQADQANAEAGKALAASAKAAGFAHVTAQAAADAGHAAEQVADPANDAIELGSPYITTDSAAGLVVLTAQGSKTIAEQQQAVAEAHAKNAQEEAAAAKSLAEQAQGDAKEAYQHAANAAGYAADARTYAKDALTYAAQAATAAAKAAASQTRTLEYDRQATADAAAADQAAGRAEGYAKDARDSADQAALDASAARAAAAEAEQAAKDARAAAERADTAATEAEQAAKDAAQAAKDAQDAAERAEKQGKAQQIETGTVPDENGAAVGGVFYVVDKTETTGDPEVIKKENCNPIIHTGDCKITARIRFTAVLDLYLCTAQDLDLSKFTCPTEATVYLGAYPTKELTSEVTDTISMEEFNQGIDPVDILFGSWIKCIQKIAPGGENGSWGGCAWAAVDVASLFAGRIIRPIADAVKALDAAARTGIDFEDAWIALRTLGLPEEVLASIGTKALDALRGACKAVSLTRITIAGKRCWVETGGPGVWQWVKDEAKDKPAAVAYEEQITGIPVGFGYVIHGTPNARGFVKFDGYKDGVLLDAKGENYAWAVKNGRFRPDFKGAQSMVDQANRQLAAVKAVGAKTAITWHVAEEETSVAIRNLFADNGIVGIQVTHTPKQ